MRFIYKLPINIFLANFISFRQKTQEQEAECFSPVTENNKHSSPK